MSERTRVPDWIREFSCPGWTNVFQLVRKNEYLYGTETLFGDWDSRVLLLAKDACPTSAIQEACDKGEARPWRHAQRKLGDRAGWRSDERLSDLAASIPGGKLYGSATANMLYDDPRRSRALPGFYDGPLYVHLQRVLSWVLESMPQIDWIARLGAEAWFLTCKAMGNTLAASKFQEYRNARRPIGGVIGKKTIRAFPLYHPAARVSNALMESGWRAFATRFNSGKAK